MFGFMFKTGTYYVLWQKIKKQFLMLLISLVVIVIIFNIYDDLVKIIDVKSSGSLLFLLLLKWLLILGVIELNVYKFKRITIEKTTKKSNKKPLTPTQEHIKTKETLLSTTDVMLEKYRDKEVNSE